MTELLLRLLPYVLPPVLGAVIGYVTNALAIRMLFRPLTEKKILGLRVPLTPGIIPRRRHDLATSIGKMVATRLITDDMLLARLREPGFVDTVNDGVSQLTHEMLNRRPGLRPDPEAVSGVLELSRGLLSSFLHSQLFGDLVHRLAETLTAGALATEADRLLPDNRRVGDLVRDLIATLLEGPVAPAAERAVQRWIAEHVSRDTPLVEMIGASSLDRIVAIVPGAYEPLLEALLLFLREPETRHELSVHGRDLLNRILRRLNVFQRLLVSATQYDRTISENMPAVVEDVIGSVERAGRNDENRSRLVEAIQSEVYEIGRTGIGTLFSRFGLQADRVVLRFFVIAVELLGREDVKDRIAEAVARFIDVQRSRTLGDIIDALSGLDPPEVTRRIVAVADAWIGRDANAERLAERVVGFAFQYVSAAGEKPLAEVLPLTPEQKQGVDRFLTDRLLSAMERRVPQIIAGLDVYTMVVQKIDGLDVESVEQLLLMVIARHLKWINLFGALIGSLIGGVQVLINLLT